MKVHATELIFHGKLHPQCVPEFSASQEMNLKRICKRLRGFAQAKPLIHGLLQAFPFAVLAAAWGMNIFFLVPSLTSIPAKIFLFGFGHGLVGYGWVVYALHEGAGHRLFVGPTRMQAILRGLAFHASRLKFADPVYYAEVHRTHHRHLGNERDGAFTHYVQGSRILRSLLPGAGILFPNDYKIHQAENYTRSRAMSDVVGGAWLAFEVYLLSANLPWAWALFAIVFVSTWFGMVLDRLRESIEHQWMATSPIWGSRELGLGPLAMLVGGGPWGQPCHFSHHLAPDLTWYQQLWLHRELREVLNPQQAAFIDYGASSAQVLWNAIRRQVVLESRFRAETASGKET